MHAGTGLPKPPRHPCRSPHQALEAEQSPQFEILVLEPLGPPSALKVQLHMLPQHVCPAHAARCERTFWCLLVRSAACESAKQMLLLQTVDQ